MDDAVGVQPVQAARHRQRDVLPRALVPAAVGRPLLLPASIARTRCMLRGLVACCDGRGCPSDEHRQGPCLTSVWDSGAGVPTVCTTAALELAAPPELPAGCHARIGCWQCRSHSRDLDVHTASDAHQVFATTMGACLFGSYMLNQPMLDQQGHGCDTSPDLGCVQSPGA